MQQSQEKTQEAEDSSTLSPPPQQQPEEEDSSPESTIQKYKARLVAKGYSQRSRVDYNETFSLVARLNTIRALIALATQKGWNIYQLDIKFTFLNGVIKEKIHIKQPLGFVIRGQVGKLLKLKKDLYGLK